MNNDIEDISSRIAAVQQRIAEVEATHARRVLPLWRKMADIHRVCFNEAAAMEAEAEIERLMKKIPKTNEDVQ